VGVGQAREHAGRQKQQDQPGTIRYGKTHEESIAGSRPGESLPGDLQIGGRGGEGNCAGRRAGVFCGMTAQDRREAKDE